MFLVVPISLQHSTPGSFSEVQRFFIEVKLTQDKANCFAASRPVAFGSFTELSNFQQSAHPPPHATPTPLSVPATTKLPSTSGDLPSRMFHKTHGLFHSL